MTTAIETTKAIKIIVTSQYGTLSRGRHSARIGNGPNATWAAKDSDGDLVITEAGKWQLHCTDGFNRVAKAVLEVKPNGKWSMTGDTSRFDVV
jgi:hypothetical protein